MEFLRKAGTRLPSTSSKVVFMNGSLFVVFLALASYQPVAVADIPPRPMSWPGDEGKTVEVRLGIYLIEFARLNSRDETFDVTGYLDVSWVDPSLALKPGEPSHGVRRFSSHAIYRPELGFVNAVEPQAEHQGDVYVDDGGRVSERLRFAHKFSSNLDLLRFPFDRQIVSVRVAPFEPFASNLELVVDPAKVGKSSTASVTDWSLLGIDATIRRVDPTDHEDVEFVLEVALQRRYTFYFWRVMLPMILMVCASWATLWFEIPNIQPQISTGVSVLLSMVTFNYSIDFSLPKVHYLTFFDKFTLASFLMVLAVIPLVTILHLLSLRGQFVLATKLQRLSRMAFPVAYFLSLAIIVFVTLG